MKKTTLLFIAFFVVAIAYCQEIEKGYYIKTDGTKIEGYFEASNFFNENNLVFKASLTGEFMSIDPAGIKEYGIENDVKFQKYTLKVEDSRIIDSGEASAKKQPEWTVKTVFLNVIIEGDASLYSYSSDKGVKFFYKVASKNISLNQLVYKRYMASQSQIGENSMYRQQLYNDVNCNKQPVSDFTGLYYEKADITKVFKRYNTCNGGENKNLSASKSKKTKFEYTVFGGIYQSTFGVKDPVPAPADVSKTTFGIGGEVAFILPMRKLSFFVKAEYGQFSAQTSTVVTTIYRSVTDAYMLNTKYLNVYLGPRYNFITTSKSKFFVDAAVVINIPSGNFKHRHTVVNDTGVTTVQQVDFLIDDSRYFAMGVGYIFNNRFGIDIHYNTRQHTLSNNGVPEGIKIQSLGVNLRYIIN